MSNDLIRVFAGYDSRQALAYNVLQHSIQRHTKRRVTVEPLMLDKLPITRRGLTEFTYSRFLVPWLCDYEGHAIFMDSDIVLTGDIGELWDQLRMDHAVRVMQDQPRFEWPSVMWFQNVRCKVLTPEFVDDPDTPLLDLNWGTVGTLPVEWNRCVGYASGDASKAKLYHFTQGLPCWQETRGLPEDAIWFEEFKQLTYTVPWSELMLRSVHAKPVLQRMMKERYGITWGMAQVAEGTIQA